MLTYACHYGLVRAHNQYMIRDNMYHLWPNDVTSPVRTTIRHVAIDNSIKHDITNSN